MINIIPGIIQSKTDTQFAEVEIAIVYRTENILICTGNFEAHPKAGGVRRTVIIH